MRIWCLGLLCVLFFSCKKQVDETAVQHDVLAVNGPATVAVNATAVLSVSYFYSNGCDRIEGFTQSRSGNTITIKAYSKMVPSQSVCTQDAGTRTIDFLFSSATPGAVALHFVNRNDSTVKHYMTVQ